MNIAEFLAARLDEDAYWADVAKGITRTRGTVGEPAEWVGAMQQATINDDYVKLDRAYKHMARHDPARVLADVAAKRAIIEEIQGMEDRIDGEWGNGRGVPDRHSALRYLAAPYADHPDFDPSRRVEVSA